MMIFMRSCVIAALTLLAAGQVHATNVNPFVNLGSAGPSNWQILALGDCNSVGGCDTAKDNVAINTSSQVDGNVGVSPAGGNLVVSSGKIYGNATVDSTGGIVGPSNITGTTTHTVAGNTLLNTLTADAISAYNLAVSDAGYPSGVSTPTLTGTVGSGPATYTAAAGLDTVNVVDLSSLTLSGSANNLTLSGAAGDVFIINITGSGTNTFSVLNGANINVTGGMNYLNVLYNVEGTGSAVCFSTGTSCSNTAAHTTDVQGVVLAPYRDITLDGAQVDGEIISGNLNVTLNNSATVDVPEPGTLMFLASGLAGLGFRIRRMRRG